MRCGVALVLLAALAGAEDPPLAKAAERVRRLIEERDTAAQAFPVSPLLMRAMLAPAGHEAVARADRGFAGGFAILGEEELEVAVTVLSGHDEEAGTVLYEARLAATEGTEKLYGGMGSRVVQPITYAPLPLDGEEAVVGRRLVEHFWACVTEEIVVVRSGRHVIATAITDGMPGEAPRLARQVLELVRGAESADPWDGKTGEEARAALVDALDSPSWGVRWRATRNLGRMKPDARSDATLARVLRDPDATVRMAALRALAARGWLERAPADARGAIAADPDWMVRLAYRRLREFDTDLMELLLVLDDPHPALRAFAFTLLQKRDEAERIPWARLRAGLGDADGAVRLAALEAFQPWKGDLVRSEAEPLLLAAVRDANPEARAKAADHLGEFAKGSPAVVEALVAALDDSSYDVRWQAVIALQEAGPGAAKGLPALTRMLDDEWLREWAAEIIGATGVRDEEAMRKLEAGLGAGDPDFRFEAARALWRLGSPPADFVEIVAETLVGDSFRRTDAAETLGELGEQARPYVPDLIAALEDEACQCDAARALGRLGAMAEAALPALERLRDSDGGWAQHVAHEAIERIRLDLDRQSR